MIPNLYFSYGMTKSGSTLGYELARAALELAGHDQPRLSLDAVLNRKKINFAAHISPEQAEALRRETDAIGHPVAIKTHTRPDPPVIDLLQKGAATAHAIYRDPRDMALSMLDHGTKARAKGKPAFSEYVTVEDTIDNLRHQTNTLRAWLSLPNVRPIYYDDLAFDMMDTTRRIISDLGLDVAPADAISIATTERFTQKNKAKRARHETEMAPEISARMRVIFAPMYDLLIDQRHALPIDGSPVMAADMPLCDWQA